MFERRAISIKLNWCLSPPNFSPLISTPPRFISRFTRSDWPDAPRAEKLLRSLAPTEAQRDALAPIFDALLENLSRSAAPERALLNLSNLCDRVPNRAAFFARLQTDSAACARLLELLSWSQALADAVIGSADNLDEVFSGGCFLARGDLRVLAGACADLDDLRRFRRAQFLRIGLLDLERQTWRNQTDFNGIVRQISDLAQVVIERALALVSDGDNTGFCVMLMGKGGARELNYSSDVDLIFLSENREDAAKIGEKLLRALNESTAAGQIWRADMRLRPEGTKGPLVSPLGYALSYYESYAAAWEWQALIKTRAVAGDAQVSAALSQIHAFGQLGAPRRRRAFARGLGDETPGGANARRTR